jgi:hypothetical protein
VRQEIAAGSGAILQLVKGALDDAENEALWRIEQVEFAGPGNRAKWFKASVERTDNFAPTDPDAVIDNMMKRYFENRIPVGRKALIQAASDAIQYQGYDVDDEDVAASVDAHLIDRALTTEQQLPLGAEARAALSIRWVQALGMFDWDEMVDTGAQDPATGQPMKQKRGDLIAAEIRQVARAQMLSEIRGAMYTPAQQTVGGGSEAEGGKPGQPGGGNGGTSGGGGGPSGRQPPKPPGGAGGANPEIHVHLPGGGKRVIRTKRLPSGEMESSVEPAGP